MWLTADIIWACLWGGLAGLLARRKNRAPLPWGLFGAFVWFIPPVFLLLLPQICPHCGQWLCHREMGEKCCDHCRAARLKAALNAKVADSGHWQPAAFKARQPA